MHNKNVIFASKKFGIDFETIISLNCQTVLQFDINYKNVFMRKFFNLTIYWIYDECSLKIIPRKKHNFFAISFVGQNKGCIEVFVVLNVRFQWFYTIIKNWIWRRIEKALLCYKIDFVLKRLIWSCIHNNST